MKKHLANIITSVRIVLAPALFFFDTVTTGFLIIYLICALSDLLDGPVARKTNAEGILGSVLDTVGDFLMYLGMMKVLIVSGAVPGWAIFWIAGALIIHITSALIAGFRFGKFYFVHSLSGKLMGVAMFFVPFAFLIGIMTEHLIVTGIISSISAIEAVFIQLKTDSADMDVLSVLTLTGKHEISEAQIGDLTAGGKEYE